MWLKTTKSTKNNKKKTTFIFLEPCCNFRLSLFVCWCLFVDAGQKIRPLRCSWTNSEINNPLWEWDHKPKAHNAILWPYLRLQCWPNWFKALPIIANNILAWEIFQGTNRRFHSLAILVSLQWRKDLCAGKPLILRGRSARSVDLSGVFIVFGEVHVSCTLYWTAKWEQSWFSWFFQTQIFLKVVSKDWANIKCVRDEYTLAMAADLMWKRTKIRFKSWRVSWTEPQQ